ncbi:3-carboxy-cis,cis-muconate cycloisomerase [Jannaschia sp. S6380]|uniref:3-carboxy-cis,cis-muconate cycloisomerase n=1 Tax=Jannaschia sp. S6380 TaxID=2926408 RepID=UPI001FF4A0AB|nr:3-carboxy-cis,cis-muconate cycloisomerase [Jannaschia sp. S6380]MCK0167210.1 3-carboxy-cis,cis-muconate cycloisomerase [Jannaschia sp. S6380]
MSDRDASSISAFAHPWLGGLFGDPDMAAIWSADASLRHMLRFEAAWSRALGAVGLAEAEEAKRVAKAVEAADIRPGALAQGTGRDGVPVPELVRLLKDRIGDSPALHHGTTSQDVIDTALALTLRATTDLLGARLRHVSDALAGVENRLGDRPLMGWTRMQAAVPITVADRIAIWRLPLLGHATRLAELRPRVEVVSFGGAAGNRAATGEHGDAIARHLARQLDLNLPARAPHAMRGDLADYAGVLARIAGSLGKMGQDMCLMTQQGIGTLRLSGGGASSAMAHKQNPVAPETLITLGRFAAVQVGGMHQAMIHENERSGAAWALEWLILPPLAAAAGRALVLAEQLAGQIEEMGTP